MSKLIADVALVHGAGFETCGVASQYSLRQAELGGELLEQDKVQAIVLSGMGPNATDNYQSSEAALMERHLLGLGVDPSKIFLDELSANTLSNLVYGSRVARDIGAESLVGVSRTTQRNRATLAAKSVVPRFGIDFNGYRIIEEDVKWTSVVREIVQISLLEMYLKTHKNDALFDLAEGYTAFIDKYFSRVKKARYSEGSARELSQ